eukprot:TRINITY_DN6974_c0_g1_i1.p1 TRINITY_DN6974_c0_g1~~TRINITY_DN6974_c0_g1_i1.p1  ORF type:complete len:350 (+),score=75.26 TRINITY_DN6974_c0_g1_i1:60-1109(+)
MAMEAPKLPQELQSLGSTAPLHEIPSPSRRRLRGKSESPEKKGSAARAVSDRKPLYHEAEMALEETRNQCSELQEKVARFHEETRRQHDAWRKRLEEKRRMRMGPQDEQDDEDDDEQEHRAEAEEQPTAQTEEISGEAELTLRLAAEPDLPPPHPSIPFGEAELQPDESESIVRKRSGRKHRHQSSNPDDESDARSRRRARRHSEPAVQTRRQSLEIPGLVAEDDMMSPNGLAFVNSLGRQLDHPSRLRTGKQQPDVRRRHSAPPTPEVMAELDAELSAPEPRKGMLTKLINFFTPQWMRDGGAVHDYAQIRRSQSRRRGESRRSGHQATSAQERLRSSERVAVYASQR